LPTRIASGSSVRRARPRHRAGPPEPTARATALVRRPARSERAFLRLTNRLAEEWYRQALAWRWERSGAVVVFDRHFFVDYHAYDVSAERRSAGQRVHGAVLARLYPKPDLVVYLDAPAEVLLARKGEGTLEALERRRGEYRAIRPLVERFVEVDATRPLPEVVEAVAAAITARLDARDRPA
jgi:thymidylate kinase